MKLCHIVAVIFSLVFFSACKKDEIIKEMPPEINKVKISQKTTDAGIIVTLWGDRNQFTTGYNALYVSLVNSQNVEVSNLPVTFEPIMDMDSMEHSSPTVQPIYNSGSKVYEGAVVFTMASGAMDSWKLNVTINQELVFFDLNIEMSKTKVTGSYLGTDGSKYIVTLMPYDPWKVGLNDFNILIHKMENMHVFSEYNDFQIEFSPMMLSMGHGSPGNSSPVAIGKGQYQGKVNFTMTGDWRLNFTLKRNGATIVENAFIDVLF